MMRPRPEPVPRGVTALPDARLAAQRAGHERPSLPQRNTAALSRPPLRSRTAASPALVGFCVGDRAASRCDIDEACPQQRCVAERGVRAFAAAGGRCVDGVAVSGWPDLGWLRDGWNPGGGSRGGSRGGSWGGSWARVRRPNDPDAWDDFP